LKCLYQTSKVGGHVFVCLGYRFFLFLRFWYWISELFVMSSSLIINHLLINIKSQIYNFPYFQSWLEYFHPFLFQNIISWIEKGDDQSGGHAYDDDVTSAVHYWTWIKTTVNLLKGVQRLNEWEHVKMQRSEFQLYSEQEQA
jgi:hypothetical protein